MSTVAFGLWEYKGMFMDPNGRSSGNHPGVIDYKGGSYVFGFNYALNYALTDVHRERRSVSVAKFSYNADGTITTVLWWNKEGVAQLGALNPFVRVEAETMAWESGPTTDVWKTGVRTAQDQMTGVYVTNIANGDFIKVRGVNFGDIPVSSFTTSVASGSNVGSIEMHLDSVGGPKIGLLPVSSTGGWDKWQSKTTAVSGTSGTHDLYFLLRGDGAAQLFNFDYWKFNKKGAEKPKS